MALTANNQFINKTQGDTRYYLNTVSLNNISAATGDLSMASHPIINLSDPINEQDAVSKIYSDKGTQIVKVITTGSSTYTNTSGLTRCKVIVLSGGGSSCTNVNTNATKSSTGSAGSVGIKYYSGLTSSSVFNCVVGA